MKKQNGREHKGRRDLILISACVLLAVFLLAAQRLLQKSGSWAVVRQPASTVLTALWERIQLMHRVLQLSRFPSKPL